MTISQIFVLSVLVPQASVFGMLVPAPIPAIAPVLAFVPIPPPAPVPVPAPALAISVGGIAQPQPYLPGTILKGGVVGGGFGGGEGHAGGGGDEGHVNGGSRGSSDRGSSGGTAGSGGGSGTSSSDASDIPNVFKPLGIATDFLVKLFATDDKAEIYALAQAVREDPSLVEKFVRMEADTNAEDLTEI